MSATLSPDPLDFTSAIGPNDSVAFARGGVLPPDTLSGRKMTKRSAGTATTVTTFYVMRIHYGFGTGCPGTGGQTPVLVQSGNTEGGLGGTINLQIANAQPGSAEAIVFGLVGLGLPLPNGCTLLVNPIGLVIVFANANGRAAWPFSVPPAVQAAFLVQGAVLDPGAVGGYALTNGVAPSAN
ncbi:MAG: hypothetical protein U1E73_06885 [Planctomycetota bacterium]